MLWVEPDTRDQVVEFVALLSENTHYSVKQLLGLLELRNSKFYSWIDRRGLLNNSEDFLTLAGGSYSDGGTMQWISGKTISLSPNSACIIKRKRE